MNLKKIIILCSLCIFLLSSCDLTSGEGEETLSADQVLTIVAETVNAALSLTPQATETYTPTITDTATVTGTPTPSPIPTSTFTRVENSGGSTGGQTGDCDNATFVSDITIPDGTQFSPGTAFIKSWRMHNSGTCNWTSSYSVVFIKGDIMSGVSPQYLTGETTSGVTRDISLELIAPDTAGTYTGYWQLRNYADQTFGQQFYVEIVVSGDTQTPTATATGATPTPTNTLAATATNTIPAVPTATDTAMPTATATATTPPVQPDLTISFVLNPASPSAGTAVDVSIQVNNQGNADAGSFTVEWWADANGPTNTWAVSSIAAGGSASLNYTYAGYATSGSYSSKAVADSADTIAESDEGNNSSSLNITVP